MRYFTKEWYNDTMVADMCFQLRKTERAAVYSDAFFERLYAVEERAYTKYLKRAARAMRSKLDADAAKAEFAANYKENLEFVKANLSEDILADVKDIRVLALGSATHDIAMRITRFCGKKNRTCESVERAYDNASEEADEAIGADAANALSILNGSLIEDVTVKDDSVEIAFSSTESSRSAIILLEGARLTDGDGNIKDMTALRHELLLSDNGGFEFSILLLSQDSSLHTVSYITSRIASL